MSKILELWVAVLNKRDTFNARDNLDYDTRLIAGVDTLPAPCNGSRACFLWPWGTLISEL